MKALVVYDSFFGNTQKIAEAVAAGLGAQAVRVAEARPEHLAGVDMLVVGSPTRSFRASPDIQEWLKARTAGSLKGVKFAAFDTRIAPDKLQTQVPRLFRWMIAYAADPIAKALRKAGGVAAAAPEGFIVLESEGPLADGELARATAWGEQLAQ